MNTMILIIKKRVVWMQVLVHDQGDVPLVRQMGQAIPPGSHAFLGIQMIQVGCYEII